MVKIVKKVNKSETSVNLVIHSNSREVPQKTTHFWVANAWISEPAELPSLINLRDSPSGVRDVEQVNYVEYFFTKNSKPCYQIFHTQILITQNKIYIPLFLANIYLIDEQYF